MELRSDSELLRALHDQHTRALCSYVVGLTNGDRGRAQDVVQETLLRAWRNPAVLEQPGGLGQGGCARWPSASSSTSGAPRVATKRC
jgi:DNA-directed RNA polymerase specialized sigma24 family protein